MWDTCSQQENNYTDYLQKYVSSNEDKVEKNIDAAMLLKFTTFKYRTLHFKGKLYFRLKEKSVMVRNCINLWLASPKKLIAYDFKPY